MSLAYPLTIGRREPPLTTPTTLEGVLDDWHCGREFKIYQGPYCTNRDVVRMKMAGVTHVRFVYRTDDSRVLAHLLEL